MNILLVEDNELQGGLLKEMLLSNNGVKVTLVDSAENALIILEDNSFDLIVSDVNLIKMTGYDLVKIVKSGRFRSIPFFMYSSRVAREEEIKLALLTGADKYIQKTGVQGIYEEVINQITL